MLPGLDNSLINASDADLKFGACPTSIFNGVTEFVSHGSLHYVAAHNLVWCSIIQMYVVIAGIVLPSNNTAEESLTTVVVLLVLFVLWHKT